MEAGNGLVGKALETKGKVSLGLTMNVSIMEMMMMHKSMVMAMIITSMMNRRMKLIMQGTKKSPLLENGIVLKKVACSRYIKSKNIALADASHRLPNMYYKLLFCGTLLLYTVYYRAEYSFR